MGALDGRQAFVSGGSGGIGRAIALALASDGADVAVNYRRDEEAALATVSDIEALGRRSAAYAASVDDADACAAMTAAVLDEFGPIDLLVHNAGIASRGRSVVQTDLTEVERNWRTHTLAAFVLAQAFVPGMRDAARGDVVMISSRRDHPHAGERCPVHDGQGRARGPGDDAREGGASQRDPRQRRRAGPGRDGDGPATGEGRDGGEDIHTLDAGSPFGHVCTPEEVADVVRALVGPTGAYLTGIKITVDGGTF